MGCGMIIILLWEGLVGDEVLDELEVCFWECKFFFC